VREIFVLAGDHVPTLPDVKTFFQIIQNKLHYAVSGQTAAAASVFRVLTRTQQRGRSTRRTC